MKGWISGIRGGHKYAARKPIRRDCRVCKQPFVGTRALCAYCLGRDVLRLPVRQTEDDSPPEAA